MILLTLDPDAARLADANGLASRAWTDDEPPAGDVVLLLSSASLARLKGWRRAGLAAPALLVGHAHIDALDQRATLEPFAHLEEPDAVAVEAMVARWRKRLSEARVPVGTGWVDVPRLRLVTDDGAVEISGQQAALLAYLATRPGVLVPEDELLREVWQYASGVRTRAVAMAVSRLRRLIEVDPLHPTVLLTERGGGYKYVPPTTQELPAPAAPAARSDDWRLRLELDPSAAGELARHAASVVQRTFGPEVDAAREALVALAPALERALLLPDLSPDDCAELGLALENVLLLTDVPEARLRLVDAVIARTGAASVGLRARLLLARARAGVRVDLRRTAADAFEGLALARQAEDPALLVHALLRANWHGVRNNHATLPLIDEAVALTEADPTGSMGAIARVQRAILTVGGDAERFRAARGQLELTLDELVRHGAFREAVDLASTVAGALHASGDSHRASAALETYQAVLARWPDRVMRADATHLEAARALDDGDPDRAIERFEVVRSLLFRDDGRPDGPFLYARAVALLDAGRHVAADRDLDLAVAELHGRIPTMMAIALSTAALSRMEQGELATAEALARQAVDTEGVAPATSQVNRAVHALALQRCGRLEEAGAAWDGLGWAVLGARHSFAFLVARHALARRLDMDVDRWRVQVEALLDQQSDRAWGPLLQAAWPDVEALRPLMQAGGRPAVPVALRLALRDLVGARPPR